MGETRGYPGAGKFGRARSTSIVVSTTLVNGETCGRDWRKHEHGLDWERHYFRGFREAVLDRQRQRGVSDQVGMWASQAQLEQGDYVIQARAG